MAGEWGKAVARANKKPPNDPYEASKLAKKLYRKVLKNAAAAPMKKVTKGAMKTKATAMNGKKK